MSALYSVAVTLFVLIFLDLKIILLQDSLTASGRKLAAVRPVVEELSVSVEERFPYLCSLRKRGSKKEACIGTLVAPRWALAAADCVDPAVPNSAGSRPVLFCGNRSGFEQKVFNTIDKSIHDLPTDKIGTTSRFALLRMDREAQGPFPTLFPYDALNENTTLAVLEPEQTEMNIPFPFLLTISARERQSIKRSSHPLFKRKPEESPYVRQEIQHNDDSIDPSLGAKTSSVFRNYLNSDRPRAMGCVAGTCGAPIVAPNGAMDGTIKVGSGDSDVVVGFGFYFGDASTFVRFANTTLQYFEPLFKCATGKACSPSPPTPSTPSRPVIPAPPVAPEPVKASLSIPVVSPSPETPVHHSVEETEHAATTSTEIVAKTVSAPEPAPSALTEEKIVAILAPESETTEDAPSPVQVPQTSKEKILIASVPELHSTEEVGSAPDLLPELTDKSVLEPSSALASGVEIKSHPATAPETTKEEIVSVPALEATSGMIPVAPAPAPEQKEPTLVALSVPQPAETFVLTPVSEPQTSEETWVSAPAPTEEMIVPVSEPETFDKGTIPAPASATVFSDEPVAIPVPEPKEEGPRVPAPAQKAHKEASLAAPSPEPETTEKELVSIPVPESTEQMGTLTPTPTPESAAEYISPPSPEPISTESTAQATLLPTLPTEVISPSPSIVPALIEEIPPPEVTTPAPSSTPQSEATKIPAPLESPLSSISVAAPQSEAYSPSPAVSTVPQIPTPQATPKAVKTRRPKDCPEDTSSLSKQSASKKFMMMKQMIPKDDEEGVRRVLCSGLDVSKHFGVQKLTLLHLAAKSNAASCISLLIESGADINSKDSLGRTPIFETINVNATAAVKELVKYDAALEIYDRFGFTALMQAALENRVFILQDFIDAGADLEAPCRNPVNEGDTALLLAAALGCIESAEVLLEHGADPDTVDKEGLTPLLSAAKHGHITIARDLIKAHARTDLVDKEGNTALHYAAEGGYLFIARDLVRAGSDRRATNVDGKRPVDLICKKPPPPMHHCQIWTYRLLQRLLSPRSTT